MSGLYDNEEIFGWMVAEGERTVSLHSRSA